MSKEIKLIHPNNRCLHLDHCSSVTLFKGNDGVNEFLVGGGAGTSNELVKFVFEHFFSGYKDVPKGIEFPIKSGCTAIQVKNREGDGYLFGRNYDYEPHQLMIVQVEPTDGYRSLSSVDTNFISDAFGETGKHLPLRFLKKFALYTPLDGINEMGLAISVNMVQDDAIISQNRGKPKLTITTAVRVILDKAANVDEALSILESCDMNSEKDYLCHLMIGDRSGKSVCVDYIDSKMCVTDTKVMTNFYMQEGPKYGIGTEQSMIRYQTVMSHLENKDSYSVEELANELKGVAKSNFEDFYQTTEWSIVFDLEACSAVYYRREDYTKGWEIKL